MAGTANAQTTESFVGLVRRRASPRANVAMIRRGARASLLGGVAAYLGLPKSQVFAALRTPASTAHRIMRKNALLDTATTERIVRVADVARLAEETFGTREAAVGWLLAPNRALGSQAPLSWLDTEPGAREVRRVLAAIDHGGVY